MPTIIAPIVSIIRLRVPENVGRTDLADGSSLMPDAHEVVGTPAAVAPQLLRMGYRYADTAARGERA